MLPTNRCRWFIRNCEEWSPVTTVTNFTGTLEFTDPDAANQAWRFYRMVLRELESQPSAPGRRACYFLLGFPIS